MPASVVRTTAPNAWPFAPNRLVSPDHISPPRWSLMTRKGCASPGLLFLAAGDYRNHTMKNTELTVTRVGNSRGVRLPAAVLRRYGIGDTLIMELRPDEIALRPKRIRGQKLSWAETYRQMATADEDWSAWEALPEGLDTEPGSARI
jgi:antitoxin MazE